MPITRAAIVEAVESRVAQIRRDQLRYGCEQRPQDRSSPQDQLKPRDHVNGRLHEVDSLHGIPHFGNMA